MISYTVVVPTFNSGRCLKRCLDSIVTAMSRVGAPNVFVVDNGSKDGTLALVEAAGPGVHLAGVHPGVSISRLRNEGARAATGTYLVFIDSDCVLCEEYFLELGKVLAGSDIKVTGATYRLPENPSRVEETWHMLHSKRGDGPVTYLNGGNLVVEKAAFDRAGGFRESLRTGEDAELCQRLRGMGFPTQERARLAVVHLGNAKTLGQFFRKQSWHAIGMLGTTKRWELDKPLMATILHGCFLLAGISYVLLGAAPFLARLGLCAAGSLLVPAMAVVARWNRSGRPRRPFFSLLLYWIYFLARIRAFLRALAVVPRKLAGDPARS